MVESVEGRTCGMCLRSERSTTVHCPLYRISVDETCECEPCEGLDYHDAPAHWSLVCQARYARMCEAVAELAIYTAQDIRTLHSVLLVVHHEPPSVDWYVTNLGVRRAARIFGARKALSSLAKALREGRREGKGA